MKDLIIEDKGYEEDEFLDDSRNLNASTCPSLKRSLISKNHSKKAKQTNNINIITNVKNYDNSELSKESPEKLHNSLNSYYLTIKCKNKSKNKRNTDKKLTKKSSNNKNININININNITYYFSEYEIPEIKEFNLYYEIPLNGKYDFIFLLRGGLSKNDWLIKSKNIRKYPRHLKNTLFFQSQIKLQNIHKQNFSQIYEIYLIIKNRGNDLYKCKKYRESLEYFNYAYGLFKWIEFKNKNLKINSINNENFVLLDEDIEEKKVIRENNNDEKLYKGCLIYILEIMAYCYIQLRLYSNAIECLDECVNITGNYFPDVYLRRAQARINNKKISDQEIKLAEKDINKAIHLALLYNSNIQKKYNNNQKLINTDIYFKIKNKYNQIIQKRLEIKVNNIRNLLIEDLNLQNKVLNNSNNDSPFAFAQNVEKQYKILKEIKKKYNLAFKFFTETKNQVQLDLTYKEYESFYETFNRFKKFYKFSINAIENKVIEKLTDKEKQNLFNIKNKKIIEKNKKTICQYIFAKGNYNAELYKYVIDKMLEEEKNKKEIENKSKLKIIQHILNLSKGKYFMLKISLCFIIISFVSIGFQLYYIKHIRGTEITEIDK